MYTGFILATMLVLPTLAVLLDTRRTEEPWFERIGKWFIFFGVGVRLLVAGLSQMLHPGFTAALLGLDGNAHIIVQELGFANLLLASVALVSLGRPCYRVLGSGGALYMGFAGSLHLRRFGEDSTFDEAVALGSDWWIFLVVLVYLVRRGLARR